MVELKNDKLTVLINEIGAEVQSIKDANGLEFMWQGAEKCWSDHSPTIFPVVGRLREKYYTYEGKTYSLPIHGFAPKANYEVQKLSENTVSFTLHDSEQTHEVYPFSFTFKLIYELNDSSLKVTFSVQNDGDNVMYYSLGGHPGFNHPITAGSDPSKYYLEFDEECKPLAVGLTDDGFVTRDREPFGLIDDKKLPLYPKEIFVPTIIFEKMSKGITMKSSNTMHTVHVRYDDFDYLALWRGSRGDYICIEPWAGLPDCMGDSHDFTQKYVMSTLNKGEKKEYSYTITVK